MLPVFNTSSRVSRGSTFNASIRPLLAMRLPLTAAFSYPGSSGEPPQKKLRITDDFLEKLGPAVFQQLHHFLDGVVGSEIRRLAAGDADMRKAYDRLRPEVGAS